MSATIVNSCSSPYSHNQAHLHRTGSNFSK
uniref:Uncharacterized protein n=1 Tax=Anguilla anguilla TaxID=7936 RepID=A0A0E9RPY1_ANGAN